MERKEIYLGSIENALRFIAKTDRMHAVMRIVGDSKNIDAKSLLGVLSLDLKEPVLLEVRGDAQSREEVWHELFDYLKK